MSCPPLDDGPDASPQITAVMTAWLRGAMVPLKSRVGLSPLGFEVYQDIPINVGDACGDDTGGCRHHGVTERVSPGLLLR